MIGPDLMNIVLLDEVRDICRSVIDETFDPRTPYAIAQHGRETVAIRILQLIGGLEDYTCTSETDS